MNRTEPEQKYTKYRTSSLTLRTQRAVDEAIISTRLAEKGTVSSASAVSLSVSLKPVPELPKSTTLYGTDFGSSSSVEECKFNPLTSGPGKESKLNLRNSADGSLFLFASLMAIFVITLVKVMGEKTSNMLSALRTAGLYESLYWMSW